MSYLSKSFNLSHSGKFLLLFAFIIISNISLFAQCPQRYKDRVFEKYSTKLNQNYNNNVLKKNTDGTISQMLYDVYQPKDDTAQLRPLIILIHGGSFTNWPPLFKSSPEIVEIARDLAKRGYVVISPDYRLFSGDISFKKMAETIAAATFDINDFMCHIKSTVENGNKFRIDTTKIFMGGSSGGAILALNFGLFLEDTTEINPEFRQYFNNTAAFDKINPQDVFENKYCSLQPKGYISLSGGLIDTNLIKPQSNNLLVIHGMLDGSIDYYGNFALANPELPFIYGPGLFMDKMQRAGIYVEADIYPDKYHVPVLFPFGNDLELALQLTLETGSIFDLPVLDSTQNHIAHFCYKIMGSPEVDCVITKTQQNILTEKLKVYPNPSDGIFNIELSKSLNNQKTSITVYDMTQKIVLKQTIDHEGLYSINISNLAKGMYILRVNSSTKDGDTIYFNQLIKQ